MDYRATNLNHLERWLGPSLVPHLSGLMKGWHGGPIALGGVPGSVFVTPDGNFIGKCRFGGEATILDYGRDFVRRLKTAYNIKTRENMKTLLQTGGFASMSEVINAATVNQYRNEMWFQKVGVTGVTNGTMSLWQSGNLPQAGGASSGAAGGTNHTSSTTGAFNSLVNGATYSGSAQSYLFTANALGTVSANTVLLYDRLFGVAKSMNTTGTEAVTGTPSRYQSATTTAADYIGGNFIFFEVQTILPNTAHNWTVCKYTAQDGSTTSNLPSLTGNNSAIAQRLDHPTGQWFAPLASGDSGAMKITQIQSSGAMASGAVNICIGHPLCWIPMPIANQMMVVDCLNTAASLVRIFDNACLALLEALKPSTTATTYTGSLIAFSN